MTEQEVITIATKVYNNALWGEAQRDKLMRFAKLVAEHERENFCAQLAQLHDYYSLASHTTTLRGQE